MYSEEIFEVEERLAFAVLVDQRSSQLPEPRRLRCWLDQLEDCLYVFSEDLAVFVSVVQIEEVSSQPFSTFYFRCLIILSEDAQDMERLLKSDFLATSVVNQRV